MEFILSDLRDGYVDLVRHVADHGRRVESRGLATRELVNVGLIFPSTIHALLPTGVGRGVNTKLAAVEALSLIGGTCSPDLLRQAAPQYDAVLLNPDDIRYGAYGPRTAMQLAECVTLLRREPGTRRAVMSIWSKDDLTHQGDRPCTVFLQFLVRDNYLELHTYMRSQDVWLGTPYDVFMFTQLQCTVARMLRLPSGQYTHHATSLHLYESNVDDVAKLHYGAEGSGQLLYELPLGVTLPDDSQLDDELAIAHYLLHGTSYAAEREANPWYAARLDETRRREAL